MQGDSGSLMAVRTQLENLELVRQISEDVQT